MTFHRGHITAPGSPLIKCPSCGKFKGLLTFLDRGKNATPDRKKRCRKCRQEAK